MSECSPNPEIVIIAAVAQNGVIGKGGALPWHIPEDLRRFRAITMGHTVIMGRRTFESMGRPLDGRRVIVISRSWEAPPPGVLLARCPEDAIALSQGVPLLFVAGGASIYSLFLPLANRLEITWVEQPVEGDTFFSLPISQNEWRIEHRFHPSSPGPLPWHAITYRRIAQAPENVAVKN
ncbi:MAG: dihydrofolate reductase [Sandaracinaceae bacterium]|nr:dihydrofolate reductase [Sandaracinaceae bacterium]